MTSAVPPPRLSDGDVQNYLKRLGLPLTLATSRPSLSHLRQLQLHQLLNIPFESAFLHLPPSLSTLPPNTPLLACQAPLAALQLGAAATRRIIDGRGGHLCFGQTGLFASLLRTLGYSCSEMMARMPQDMGKDPAEVGCAWKGTTHAVLIVGWEGEEDRWFVDIGYGGAQCPFPIKLVDGERGDASRSPTTAWKLSYGPLPHSDLPTFHIDHLPHWTYWRWEPSDTASPPIKGQDITQNPGYWSPLCAFSLQTATPVDLALGNHYSVSHPDATFTSFFYVTKYVPLVDGEDDGVLIEKALVYRWRKRNGEELDEEDRGWAKLIVGEDVQRKIKMEAGPIKEVLEREFGFTFD